MSNVKCAARRRSSLRMKAVSNGVTERLMAMADAKMSSNQLQCTPYQKILTGRGRRAVTYLSMLVANEIRLAS